MTEVTPSMPSPETTPTVAPTDAAPVAAPVVDPTPAAPADGEQPTLLNQKPAAAADDGKPAADGEKPKDGDAPAAAEVPEAYTLEAPEGFTIAPESIELVTPVFKELGLTNDQANKLMPVAAQFAEQVQRQMLNAHVATTAEWGRQALADPELGNGSVETFQANMGIASKALDDLAGPEFRQFLDETGLGNHPAMIRFALRAGKAISDEARIFKTDSSTTPAPVDPTEHLYPDDQPKQKG